MERPLYINWLVNEEGVTFEDGVALKCYKLSYETDEAVFDDWALHIRKHYVEDDELTDDSVATGLSIEDYLREFIIPQRQETFGPTARSNDISVIKSRMETDSSIFKIGTRTMGRVFKKLKIS